MARPISKPNQNKTITNEQPTTPTINTEELIAKAVAEALSKREEELKLELANKVAELSQSTQPIIEEEPIKSKPKSRMRKFIPDNARVRLELNIDGKFIIADKKGASFFIEMNGYKDSVTMQFSQLKNFHGRSHTFLSKGKLIITDIVSENDVTVEDVIADLNLQKIYNNEKSIRPDEIENYLLDEISVSEFESKMNNSMDIMETIVEVAVILFKRGQFTDNTKMNVFRQILRNPALFTN